MRLYIIVHIGGEITVQNPLFMEHIKQLNINQKLKMNYQLQERQVVSVGCCHMHVLSILSRFDRSINHRIP